MTDGDRVRVRVRRSPRIGVFLLLGVLLGVLAAVVATLLTPADSRYSTGQVLGYLVLLGAPIGAAVGAAVAIVLDAVGSRRARTATAERAAPGRTPPGED
jgi:hypothetical protein